jgi:hypothetical protein
MNHPAPSLDLKMRILRAVEDSPVPTRATESLRAATIHGAAVLATLGIYFYLGGIHVTGRSPWLVFGTAAGSLLIACLGLVMLTGRNRTMLGRPRLLLLASAILLPLALVAWKVYFSSHFPNALDRWSTRAGYRCLALSLSLGIIPLLATLYTRRGTDPSHPNTAGLAMGAAVGLGVAVLVDLWCPVAYVPHLLLGHVLPIGILAVVGAAVGRKLLWV